MHVEDWRLQKMVLLRAYLLLSEFVSTLRIELSPVAPGNPIRARGL